MPDAVYQRAWKLAHPESVARSNAKRRGKYQSVAKPKSEWRPIRPKTCIVCGNQFQPVNGSQLYCSDRCRKTARTKPCSLVGCDRTTTRSGRDALCDLHHRRKRLDIPLDWVRPEPKPKTCPVVYATCRCGELYVRAKRAKGRAHCVGYIPVPQERQATCIDCGLGIVVQPYERHRCNDCADVYRTEQLRIHSDRRRIRERDAFVEPVWRSRVYERDGWRCGICRRPLKRDAVVPHPMAPTLDHIVPLSRGGEHSYANVQAAHFRCNSAKGARGEDQLRLAM